MFSGQYNQIILIFSSKFWCGDSHLLDNQIIFLVKMIEIKMIFIKCIKCLSLLARVVIFFSPRQLKWLSRAPLLMNIPNV